MGFLWKQGIWKIIKDPVVYGLQYIITLKSLNMEKIWGSSRIFWHIHWLAIIRGW